MTYHLRGLIPPLSVCLLLCAVGCEQTPAFPAPPPPPEATPTSADRDGDGYTLAEGDCDDGRSSVGPGAVEAYDQLDNDCDGAVDEDVVPAEAQDLDGDGYSPSQGDCDNQDASVNPDADELLNDGIDQDCDGVVDEGAPDSWGRRGEAIVEVAPSSAAHSWHDTPIGGRGPLLGARDAGDLDGDGHHDLIFVTWDSWLTGEVYILYGPVDQLPAEGAFADLADARIVAPSLANSEAWGVAAGGDLNADGRADLVVSDGQNRLAAVFLGGARLSGDVALADAQTLILAESEQPWRDGVALSVVGDLNGDGFDDLVMGQPAWSNGRGRCQVLLGGQWPTTLDSNSPAFSLEGGYRYELGCSRVEPAGDMDGDGLADMIVFSIGINKMRLIYGASLTGERAALSAVGVDIDAPPQRTTRLARVAHGDFDGDGLDDLGVALPHTLDDVLGQVHVIYGDTQRLTQGGIIGGLAGTTIYGSETDYFFGVGLAMGDVDGDGLADLAAGSRLRWSMNGAYDAALGPGCDSAGKPGFPAYYAYERCVYGGAVSIFQGRAAHDAFLSAQFSGQMRLASTDYGDVLTQVVPGGTPNSVKITVNWVASPDPIFHRLRTLRFGDLDGDNRDDLILGNQIFPMRDFLLADTQVLLSSQVLIYPGSQLVFAQ